MQSNLTTLRTRACRISIRGVVQGVGFRPFVYRTAIRHSIAGWVVNDHAGVEIYAEANTENMTDFLVELRNDWPPAAKIVDFSPYEVKPEGITHFEIRASQRDAAPSVRISADLSVCDDCLREMNDPTNRRYQYPYINCTNCGPRYSLIEGLPYDRSATTMAAWELCSECRREFEDPLDRRYHAQPMACAQCGPGFRLLYQGEWIAATTAAIQQATTLLREGNIVAIKGIGGFHLACDARNATAVKALRERKFRMEQPFAIMVRTLDEARELVELSPAHEMLLCEVARPIVLATTKRHLPEVAPDNSSLGIMLPYAPLHHLLFACGAPSPLVVTSANRSSEPIAYDDKDAVAHLSGIADAFLIGERRISRRVDDSVVTIRNRRSMMIRRSRGYAPLAVCQIPASRPLLGVGGDLKNTITLVIRGQAFVSQHIGDLENLDSRMTFETTVQDLLKMYDVPMGDLIIAHDLHPQFHSTQFAQSLRAFRHIAVQHHHAHIASVLAEHELGDERVIGVAWDGTGLGLDGAIWGSEFFVGSLRTGLERCKALRPFLLPGGDAAAKTPIQAAAAFLADFTDLPDMTKPPFYFSQRFLHAMMLVRKNLRCFSSTSAGRLFDAVAALLGFTRENSFEGQAAIWLENLAKQSSPQTPYVFRELDHRQLFRALIKDRMSGRPCGEIAAAFHQTLACAIVEMIQDLSQQHNVTTVALSGGVFQNELLGNSILQHMCAIPKIRLITNERVPVNDGGISLGQVALAANWGA